ncbi:MAG: hypothetical protein ACXWKD_15465 [Caldimonas sp.]
MNAKKLAIVSMALAGVLAAASVEAHGRDDVRFSVTIGSPGWSQPAPVYVPVARSYDRHDEGSYRHAPTRWDRDGDGIPNRYDRVYNPSWDRDGDGIPNRYDRHDDTRHDRDGRGASRR